MNTLVDITQRRIAELVADLEGDEDFMSFMAIRGSDGVVLAGLMMPGEDAEKDGLADMMMGLCAVNRADEAVFVSSAWIVIPRDGRMPRRALSQHPDRAEVVFMVAIDGDGEVTSTAPVTRADNRVSIGEWSSFAPTEVASSRFGEAIHMGMDIGRRLPPDMCAYCDRELAAGRAAALIAMFTRALGSARSSVLSDIASRN